MIHCWLCWFCVAAVTDYHRLGALRQQKFSSHRSEDQKSKVCFVGYSCSPADSQPRAGDGPVTPKKTPGGSDQDAGSLVQREHLVPGSTRSQFVDQSHFTLQLSVALPHLARPAFPKHKGLPHAHSSLQRRHLSQVGQPLSPWPWTPNNTLCRASYLKGTQKEDKISVFSKPWLTGIFRVCLHNPAIQHLPYARPEFSRAMIHAESLGENLYPASSSCYGCQHSLACGSLSPFSKWRSSNLPLLHLLIPFCVCVYLLPLPPFNKIHVIAFRAHLSLGILACAQATITKYYTLGGLNNGNLLPTPGGWKSQIRVHQGSVSGELSSSLADVYLLTMSSLAFSPCVYMELGYGRESSLVSHEDTDPHLWPH